MSYTANFAYRREEPATAFLSGLPEIFDKLAERDVNAVMSFDAENAFSEEGITNYQLADDGIGKVRGTTLALDNVDVIVNRMGRSVKYEHVPGSEFMPPMVNENATRSLAFRKHLTASEVLLPLGLTMPTALINGGEDIEAFLTSSTARTFVVKPDAGDLGKGIHKVERSAVQALFTANRELFGKNVIQPAYDFSGTFPASLRAYDAASQEAFASWNVAGKQKELRVYGFHSPEQTTVFPVARVTEGGDHWFFVDPETVPAELIEGTRKAMALTAKVSGAMAVHGTVDYGYGSFDASVAPHWQAIELNGRAPYVISYDKHYGVADRLRDQFADMVAETALVRTTAV